MNFESSWAKCIARCNYKAVLHPHTSTIVTPPARVMWHTYIIMKRLFTFIIAAIVCCTIPTSCNIDKIGGYIDIFETTYTVTSEVGEVLGAEELDLHFFEYNANNEMINQQVWKNVEHSASQTFTASSMAKKLVIYIDAETAQGDIEKYVSQIFYLSKTTQITLNGDTAVQDTNPIK